MSQEKPNNYPSEFKESSVKLALESDQSMAQTARDLGINPNTLYGWVSQYSQSNTSQPSAIRTDEHLYDELKRLKKENARLKEERDILKNVWSAPNLLRKAGEVRLDQESSKRIQCCRDVPVSKGVTQWFL